MRGSLKDTVSYAERDMTIFDQEARFSEPEPSGPSEVYLPPSTLDTRTTKIVDAWANVDTPRFDSNLVIQSNGLLIRGKMGEGNEGLPLNLPDMGKTKKLPPAYSFPRQKRFVEAGAGIKARTGHDSQGAIYDLPRNRGTERMPSSRIR